MFRQIGKLLLLVFAHMSADLLGGLFGAILPILVAHFQLPLSSMLALITVLGFSSNGFQIVAGHLPLRGEKPWPITAGLLIAGLIPLVALVPPGPWAWILMTLLMIAGGAGIALVHPNGLRALYHLDQIPPSFATSCFMVGGFAGFAGGAWVSSALVNRFQLFGLLALIPLAILAAFAVPLAGIRLSTETIPPALKNSLTLPALKSPPSLPFSAVFSMGLTAATASLIITNLLPTRLHELGHPLPFGGQSIFLFGVGGAIGSLFWGALSSRYSFRFSLTLSLSIGVPLLVLYLFVAPMNWARFLLGGSGFFLYPSFPLIVTLARFSSSTLSLSQRMGWIVGGTWGLAGLFLITIGPLIEKTTLSPFLHISWACYLICLIAFVRSHKAF